MSMGTVSMGTVLIDTLKKRMCQIEPSPLTQISATIEDIYGFEVSEGFVADVTDKILPEV